MNRQNPFDPSYPWTRPGDPLPVSTRPDVGMDPPASEPPAPARSPRRPQSRRARRHRRQVIRRGIGIGFVIAAILAFVLIATDSIRLPGESRPVFAANAADEAVVQTSPNQSPVRVLSATTPMRLWITGDSLSYVLGQTLGKQTAATGVVKPIYDARVSSGLNSPQFFDWPKHATKEIARLDPEAIVFIIGANDVGVVNGSNWKTTYGERVDQMMKILTGPDAQRHVYWIGPPTFRDKTRNEQSRQLNDLMREQAAQHRNVTFIDGYAIFADDNGRYQSKLPDLSGKDQLVRTDDGVHFTAKGGERLANAVFTVLDQQWQLRSQAVPGATQTIEETEGCCRTPNGSNNTQWLTGPPAAKTATTSGKSTTTTKKSSSSSSTAPASSTTTSPPATTTTTKPATTTTT